MKLFVSLFLLAILSLSLLLSGCAEPEPVPTPNTGHGDRPFMNDFRYDTVEELSGGLTSYFTEDVLQDYEDHYGPERGGVFRSFITNLQNGSVPLYVPTYLGEEIEYPNEEGRSNISLFPSDLYSKPWIWFASNEYGVNCIYTMYLDELTKEHFNENGIHGLYEELNTEQYPNVTIGGFQPLFQEDFAELLRLYDNMQVPAPPNAKLTFMEFSPSRHYNRFTLSYTIEETGEHYGFTFSPYKSNQSVWETIKKNTKSKPKCLYTNGSNISVYDNGRNTTASYTSTGLKDGSIKIKDIAVEDIFKDICLTPLCDIPWDNTEKTAQP